MDLASSKNSPHGRRVCWRFCGCFLGVSPVNQTQVRELNSVYIHIIC